MTEKLEGYIERIVYRNAENGYTVLELSSSDSKQEIVAVGTLCCVSEGEFLQAEGTYVTHAVYGEQFQIQQYHIKEPENCISMERYLASGTLKGIGPVLAKKIIEKFKEKTFQIIEEEPERLAEIKGISARKAREIAIQFEEKKEMRSAMLFLAEYKISETMAVKIYEKYGMQIYTLLKENPYQLAEDIHGIGFLLADEIAKKVGIAQDSDVRMKAAILYILVQASYAGNIFLPKQELLKKISNLLQIEIEHLEQTFVTLALEKKIIIETREQEERIYYSPLYYAELNVARMLLDLNMAVEEVDFNTITKQLQAIEQQAGIQLDTLQRTAILETIRSGVFILTGGPGTGKTTTIHVMIQFLRKEGYEILLAAPTGRAAKRLSETTGMEAQTIHRLLEMDASVEQGNASKTNEEYHFGRKESHPLETDVIIIDEVSMVDIYLMQALLRAISVGTKLILVGDVDQLPSVGPGNVLKDLIDSHAFCIVMLKKIFRQARESDIIINAHKINAGENIELGNQSKDFFFLQRTECNTLIRGMIALVKEKLPRYVHTTPLEIQVLTPMRKGELGCERLNQILQHYLNPSDGKKKEKEFAKGVFREGDKVIQIKNNYQLEWEVKNSYGMCVDKGIGVFNGDIGIIKEIRSFSEVFLIEYEENKCVEYPFSCLDELELAYAITIHKSQGSEYPAVVIPLFSGPELLLHRNLLYTAVTRAKQCVVLLGRKEIVEQMIQNTKKQKRYSALAEKIQELNK